MVAPVYNTTWRNKLWMGWFYLQLPLILLVDLLEFIYPETMYKPEGSPLHFAWKLHEFYISTYNDPIVQWSPQTAAQHDNWMGLFLHVEFLFLLPVVLWGLYRLGVQQNGTRGTDELLFFVYALEMAFTTLVCLHDTWYWDPTVYSDDLKWVFRSQLYGPWFFIPLLGAVDMGSRLVGRLNAAEEAAVVKKAN
ncbi:transmembrane protein 6/97 [Cladorrhinum samala]|uniref:Efficient mitochondria targeting-associated protein 19 n=1 Tax=Cladorrhinum samala TaxID=585594 RepID=A0AAV9HGZ0_9PEZI|nr:transmembrane protein 6/97 [Cladorrhinum samala]